MTEEQRIKLEQLDAAAEPKAQEIAAFLFGCNEREKVTELTHQLRMAYREGLRIGRGDYQIPAAELIEPVNPRTLGAL